MLEEEKKEGEGTSTPASGEPKPKDQPEEPKTPPAGPDNQVTELQQQIDELKETNEKLTTQVGQAGYNIQKYKERLKELGEDLDEEEKITEDKVRQIVKESSKESLEEIKRLNTQLSELFRAQQAKQDAGKQGAGAGGQVPPPKKKEPQLSAEDRKILETANLHWDPAKEAFVSADGKRTYKLEEVRGIESPQT